LPLAIEVRYSLSTDTWSAIFMDNPDSKTILIAATDPNIIYLLQRYAEASGFQTMQCGIGEDLVNLASQVQPVLVILQIDLPVSAWQQSLKMLKTDPMTEYIPIIAYACMDELASCQSDGIASTLQKSVLYSDFQIALEQTGVLTHDTQEVCAPDPDS
jgi:CheY-like chemotaxis protein